MIGVFEENSVVVDMDMQGQQVPGGNVGDKFLVETLRRIKTDLLPY